MRAQREKNTGPEVALRRELHRRGLRYRLHRQVLPDLRRELDIVFGPAKVAVDVRGCFWHACPEHATYPRTNSEWWKAKLERNVERDRETEERLAEAGWSVVVVWEHEDPESGADRVQSELSRR